MALFVDSLLHVTSEHKLLGDLSVLVTCYNKLEFIDGFLKQVEELNKYGCQIVIIDDGSIDGSGDLINSHVANLQNCKYVRQENQGSAAARNRAITESDRKFIQFLDLDDFLNIGLLIELFKSQKISENELSIFEFMSLTKPEFPGYSREFERKLLSDFEKENELFSRMGYWRIIYPRKIIIDYSFRFTPTFADLRGERFILDDLFWLIHIASTEIKCLKYQADAITYGYVKLENDSTDNGNDFANQASLFPLAISKVFRDLNQCNHPHNKQFLNDAVGKTLQFHASYVRPARLSFYIKSIFSSGIRLQIDESRILNELVRLRLCLTACSWSLKFSIRKFAYNYRATTKVWEFLKRQKINWSMNEDLY